MIPLPELEAVKRSIQHKPSTMAQIYADHAALWQQLGWTVSQIKLWLACIPGIRIVTEPDDAEIFSLNRSEADSNNLADEMVALLNQTTHPKVKMSEMGASNLGWINRSLFDRLASNG